MTTFPAKDSTVSGPLLPGPGVFRYTFDLTRDPSYWLTADPTDGQPLDDFVQQLVAGITNLPSTLVRPRFQQEPVTLPPVGTEWVAVGVMTEDLFPGYSWEGFEQDDQYYEQQHEAFEVLISCYGPRADWYDGLIRDGLAVSQNREVLYLAGMGLVSVDGKTVAPELINAQWWRRVDRRVRMNREIRRAYPVLSLLSGAAFIRSDPQVQIMSVGITDDAGELLLTDDTGGRVLIA